MNLLPTPGQRLHLDMGGSHAFNGTCMCRIQTEWSEYALVMLDCGEVHECGAMRQIPGIGWHAGAVSWAHEPTYSPSKLGAGSDE